MEDRRATRSSFRHASSPGLSAAPVDPIPIPVAATASACVDSGTTGVEFVQRRSQYSRPGGGGRGGGGGGGGGSSRRKRVSQMESHAEYNTEVSFLIGHVYTICSYLHRKYNIDAVAMFKRSASDSGGGGDGAFGDDGDGNSNKDDSGKIISDCCFFRSKDISVFHTMGESDEDVQDDHEDGDDDLACEVLFQFKGSVGTNITPNGIKQLKMVNAGLDNRNERKPAYYMNSSNKNMQPYIDCLGMLKKKEFRRIRVRHTVSTETMKRKRNSLVVAARSERSERSKRSRGAAKVVNNSLAVAATPLGVSSDMNSFANVLMKRLSDSNKASEAVNITVVNFPPAGAGATAVGAVVDAMNGMTAEGDQSIMGMDSASGGLPFTRSNNSLLMMLSSLRSNNSTGGGMFPLPSLPSSIRTRSAHRMTRLQDYNDNTLLTHTPSVHVPLGWVDRSGV